jgi:hypothetical protein
MPAKKDFTQVAFAVFQQAVGEVPKPKLTARQEAGRKGGLKGGKGRMEKLTEAQRTELALKGVAGRKKAPTGEAGAGFVKKIS